MKQSQLDLTNASYYITIVKRHEKWYFYNAYTHKNFIEVEWTRNKQDALSFEDITLANDIVTEYLNGYNVNLVKERD